MTEGFIAARQVSMVYETAQGEPLEALRAVSLEVRRGEFVSLIGPSGCGKSTLLHIIGGLIRPTGGEVRLAGEPVTGPAPRRAAFVFQDYTLFPWRPVLANVEVGLQFRGVPLGERRAKAEHYLDLVGLRAFARSYPTELSGGMQQRVAIARALCMETDVLLMDEPFGALDEQTRMIMGEELQRILGATGKSILFVTHSLAEAVYLSDRVVVMSARPGKVTEILTVDQPRPREPRFMTSELFTRLRNRLFDLLHDEIRATALAELRGEAKS